MITLTDLKNMQEHELKSLFRSLQTSYEAFARICLGHIVTEVPKFHSEMYSILDKRYEHNAFVMFRGGAKSTISKTIQTTADICFGREPFTLLLSESAYQASKDLISITDELENNEIIHALFGNLKGETKWNQEEIEAANGCFVSARGYGSRIRGLKWKNNRITKFILDDYESEQNTGTQKQRDAVKDWIDAQVLPAGVPGETTYQFFGTIVHPDAHLATIKDLPSFKPPHGCYMEVAVEHDGVPTWPSRFPMDYINMKREEAISKNKLSLFLQEMYNIPAVQGRPVFNIDMIRQTNATFHLEESHTYIEYDNRKIPINVFIGVDPAVSLKEDADYSVFFVVGQLPDKSFLILDIIQERMSPTDQAKTIFNLVKKYNPYSVTIETQGYQQALADICKDMMPTMGRFFTIRDFKSGKSKSNKWLLSLDPIINEGRMNYIKDCNNIKAFFQECTSYNQEYRDHDDTVDGAFLATLHAYPPSMYDVDAAIDNSKNRRTRKKTPLNWMLL